ncbi:TetR/AcrR family transcriptional regulator [Jannaschia formosa]|uniref:TetR/AcrR family transcriptional regulator n=1 Tax=Jannaschia formosa TaxID=2259592 RepID=UPI0014309ABF|nr:TetR/AcrR family transcriptional regulator [Jannaschia formosa]
MLDADLSDRADAILSLARAAFVEKGFEGASMQDLARAAGMSAGNFYRYFPSKAALVDALIARDLLEIEEQFQRILTSPDPLATLKAALRERLAAEDCQAEGPLWAEIVAASARRPEVAAALRRVEDGVVRRVAEVLAVVHGVPTHRAEARFGTHGRLIFLIMQSAMISVEAEQPQDADLTGLILRTIDRLVDDALLETQDFS